MRIIILSVNQIYANKVVKDLLEEFKKEIVLIIEPKGLLPKESLLTSLKKILRISGFEYFIHQSAKILLFRVIGKIYTFVFPKNTYSKFYLMKKLAKSKMIDIINVRDVNHWSMLELIKKKKADLIISVFFNQILDKKIIKIPKIGAVNIHPGYLPDYKGTSPVYWALVNSEKYAGISIHKIDEGIDTGPIYKRVKIRIGMQDTEDSLYWKCVIEGSRELIDIIKKLKKGEPRSLSNRGGNFFSFPTKKSVKKFRDNKRSFFKLRQFLFDAPGQ